VGAALPPGPSLRSRMTRRKEGFAFWGIRAKGTIILSLYSWRCTVRQPNITCAPAPGIGNGQASRITWHPFRGAELSQISNAARLPYGRGACHYLAGSFP
jgi:hypothetical protein